MMTSSSTFSWKEVSISNLLTLKGKHLPSNSDLMTLLEITLHLRLTIVINNLQCLSF